MSRLTEVDEYGNADIIGMEDETWQMGLSFNDMNKMTLVLNRLHRLEKLYEHHKQPDPDTGLMPCGCGGFARVAVRYAFPDERRVYCERCWVTTDWLSAPISVLQFHWNRAMGWKGGAK